MPVAEVRDTFKDRLFDRYGFPGKLFLPVMRVVVAAVVQLLVD